MTSTAHRNFREGCDGPEKWCTRCQGWKPISQFSQRRAGSQRAGEYLSRCKVCQVRGRVQHHDVIGWVPRPRVDFIFKEMVMRVGMLRAAALIGMTPEGLSNICQNKTKNVQKRYVRRAMLSLRDLRSGSVWDRPRVGRPFKVILPDDRAAGYKRVARAAGRCHD